MLIMFFFHSIITAQQHITISGKVLDVDTQNALENAVISMVGVQWTVVSNREGIFEFKGAFPLGEQLLTIKLKGFITRSFPIVISKDATLNLGEITMDIDVKHREEGFATIDLTNDQEFDTDDGSQNQTLLQANRDPFLNSVAFNWSSTFFKVRGLGSEYSKVVLNGIEMNSFFNRRPDWSNWSGLNDMLRNQEFTPYGQVNRQTFGSLIGVNQLYFDAMKYKKGSKIALASTNRSYQGRLMLTKHSGELLNGWAYSFSASLARASEGYIKGTVIRNYSLVGSISKKISKNHRLNFTTIYTPVVRGKISPNTQEIIDIKGRQYNSYWGLQDGKLRNSRVKKVKEPIFTLNHFWELNNKVTIQNNFLYQTGQTSNSRLEFNGKQLSFDKESNIPIFTGTSRNPDPTYYQRLPSVFLQDEGEEDFESAFKADREFRRNGQLDWEDLYTRNGGVSTGIYVLYEDVVEI